MLISTHADVTWNPRNKKHYVDLGYEFTKMGDCISVKIEDLTVGSQAVVNLKCDYCGEEYSMHWHTYVYIHRWATIHKDCCKNCSEIKATEVVCEKYGDHSEMFYSSNKKRKETCIEKYGVENPFSSDIIKERIIKTNIEKYGFPHSQQAEDVRKKTIQTCRNKYGVDNYVELFKGKFIKENSPVWKGGVEHSRAERATYEYNTWRSLVFGRDGYTCQKCGARSGQSGKQVELNAHHILNWRDNELSRYDVDNGITLCSSCHSAFHSMYGKRNNTKEQLQQYLV